jgi:hypothetical protein
MFITTQVNYAILQTSVSRCLLPCICKIFVSLYENFAVFKTCLYHWQNILVSSHIFNTLREPSLRFCQFCSWLQKIGKLLFPAVEPHFYSYLPVTRFLPPFPFIKVRSGSQTKSVNRRYFAWWTQCERFRAVRDSPAFRQSCICHHRCEYWSHSVFQKYDS